MFCGEKITFWLDFGQILDPHSHLSTVIPIAHFCEVVQSLDDLL